MYSRYLLVVRSENTEIDDVFAKAAFEAGLRYFLFSLSSLIQRQFGEQDLSRHSVLFDD